MPEPAPHHGANCDAHLADLVQQLQDVPDAFYRYAADHAEVLAVPLLQAMQVLHGPAMQCPRCRAAVMGIVLGMFSSEHLRMLVLGLEQANARASAEPMIDGFVLAVQAFVQDLHMSLAATIGDPLPQEEPADAGQ